MYVPVGSVGTHEVSGGGDIITTMVMRFIRLCESLGIGRDGNVRVYAVWQYIDMELKKGR